MNPTRLFSLALFTALSAGSSVQAGIASVDIFRNLVYSQTGDGNTTTPGGAFVTADLFSTGAGDYTSATWLAGGTPYAMTAVSPARFNYTPSAGLPNKAAIDAAYPAGLQTFVTNTGEAVNTLYSNDAYSTGAPFLLGTDYTSLQGMNPADPFTFHPSAFITSPLANQSFMFFNVTDTTLGTVAFSQLFLPTTTASITLPGNTLAYGHAFTYELDYSSRQTPTGATLAFEQRTTGAFSSALRPPAVPEPGTALFGLALAGVTLVRRRK